VSGVSSLLGSLSMTCHGKYAGKEGERPSYCVETNRGLLSKRPKKRRGCRSGEDGKPYISSCEVGVRHTELIGNAKRWSPNGRVA